MKLLRTLPTRTLLLLAMGVAVLTVGAAIAVAARSGGGSTPPPKPLANALHDAVVAQKPSGITARITFTNKLFPSGSLVGGAGSALMSGASGRLWLTQDGRGRLELQSSAGDAQIVWTTSDVTVYDASSNTAYHAKLPVGKPESSPETSAAPSLAQIVRFLAKLGAYATISTARPENVAGQPAYGASLSPKHDGGLLGSVQLAWDAARGIPLRAAIYAQGGSSPVLELTATDISYGPVPARDVEVSPPSGAKTVELSPEAASGHGDGASSVAGLGAVRAAAGFSIVAPDALVGLPRKDVRLLGRSDSRAALVTYGQSLGAILLVERKADAAASSKNSTLSALPAISLDGSTGRELATQLGTVLEWRRGGVDYVLAGSLPPAAAEAAARSLR